MTLRLVAIMGIVLALCMGAFALIANSYHQQVLEEAGQIATDSAKAVFGTWTHQRRIGTPGAERTSQLTIVGDVDPEATESLIREITARQELEGGAADLFVRVEDIRARTSADELILTIPTVETVDSSQSEIQLPIPVQQYDELFAGARRRSLFLFFGVFLVGILLSAGAAARFTRPARKLDEALRDLSDGDLDTEVSVKGDDEMARLGGAFNEMTRKLRANRERTRQLARRDKLSALGRLAAGVAHDVRNPLHSIGLTLDHLNDTGRPETDERAREFDRSLGMIRGEIRRLDQLVVNFLRFAQGGSRERETIDLRSLVEETAQLLKKETQWRSIDMELELEPVPELSLDVEAIRSSLLNLVLNSCEAMPDGGKLTIGLREEEGEVVLEVRDTGRGIPEADQEKVFDFGYSTREDGSGLGLVMVHQCVVEEHDGHVRLKSEENVGTTIQLAFPKGATE